MYNKFLGNCFPNIRIIILNKPKKKEVIEFQCVTFVLFQNHSQ
jgi:hypothetical protein